MEGEQQAIIIDCGSNCTRVGVSGDVEPTSVFPTIIGKPKDIPGLEALALKDLFVGEEAHSKQGILNLRNPFNDGNIKNWDDMEAIIQHSFEKVPLLNHKEHPVFLTERPRSQRYVRERFVQMMFETFEVPRFYLANQINLALYSTQRTTGVVLDCGEDSCRAMSVVDGYSDPHSFNYVSYAGRNCTAKLRDLLREKDLDLRSRAEMEIVKDIKEKHAQVSLDIQNELFNESDDHRVPYKLPSGEEIELGPERFVAGEVLFDPRFIFLEGVGVDRLLHDAIRRSDPDVRNELWKNVVLSGGATMMTGFAERLKKELDLMAPPSVTVDIDSSAENHLRSWMGGSIVACLENFQSNWLSLDLYDEEGPNCVHRYCLL